VPRCCCCGCLLHVDEAQAATASFFAFHREQHGEAETPKRAAAFHLIRSIAHHDLGIIVPRSKCCRQPAQRLGRKKVTDGGALLGG